MNVLGINEGHMCSAALIQNGKLAAAVSEERFTRNKNQMGYPKKSIDYCLEEGAINKDEIDFIACARLDLPAYFEVTKRYPKFSIDDYVKENNEYWKPKLIEKKDIDYFSIFPKVVNKYYDFSFLENTEKSKWNELFKKERLRNIVNEFNISEEKVVFVDHHACHAHYAYFMSPFRKNVLIITADAFGDGCNCSISIGNERSIELKFKSANHNLARLYKYITLLLGMKPNEHEYKVMGLAPYANEYIIKKPYQVFNSTLYVDGLDFKYQEKPTDHYFWFKEKLEGCRFDGIAGGLQKYVEDIMKKWVTNALKIFKKDTVVISGGLGLNIKINQEIAAIPEVQNIFVAGGGGDESLSIGSALFLSNKLDLQNEFNSPLHDYHGPEIEPCNIEKILEEKNVKSKFHIKYNISNKEIAEYLKDDWIIGRCKGRSEFGPRSLGNRSILANPSNIENYRKINQQIKFRDFWMPFTPSILLERVNDYVLNPKNISSPYMTIAFNATDLAKKELIAAIHPSDYTIRPQFVDKKYNTDYHDLISKFEKDTGIGGLLNTSLNLHGEPVVGNAFDALHTLLNSELDALVINNDFLYRRK